MILAVFSCVLFSGSCQLCAVDIQPQINGIPPVSTPGFVFSVALAIYIIRGTLKKR